MGLFGRKSAAKKAEEAKRAEEAKKAEEARRAAAERQAQSARRAPAPQPAAAKSQPEEPGKAHKASMLIKKEFDAKGLNKARVDVHGQLSVVRVGFKGDTAPGKEYIFASVDEDNDVTVRCETVASVPADKLTVMRRVINECNCSYRFAKLYIDKDNDICMQADIPQETSDETVGAIAYEYLLRMVRILDNVYPKIMKGLWG